MLNFYGLLSGIVLTDYALGIQEQDILKQGWNTKNPVKYNNMKSYYLPSAGRHIIFDNFC